VILGLLYRGRVCPFLTPSLLTQDKRAQTIMVSDRRAVQTHIGQRWLVIARVGLKGVDGIVDPKNWTTGLR
jgi:hypothetical protein